MGLSPGFAIRNMHFNGKLIQTFVVLWISTAENDTRRCCEFANLHELFSVCRNLRIFKTYLKFKQLHYGNRFNQNLYREKISFKKIKQNKTQSKFMVAEFPKVGMRPSCHCYFRTV